MKKLAFILFFISASLTAQDSSYNYYPLKIGNKWVYNHYWLYSGNTKITRVIIDTAVINGHKYYKFRNQSGPPGSGYNETFERVDSATGSIRLFGEGNCPWLTAEKSLDSLRGAYPDSSFYSCSQYSRFLRDTSYTVLGINRVVKGFSHNSYFEYSRFRAFAFNIGLIKDYIGGPPGNNYNVDLLGCVINGIVYGDTNITGLQNVSSEIPEAFSLHQNYPNPFNPVTNIKFDIPKSSFTRLVIYDMLGTEIEVLVNKELNAGIYQADWNASAYPSGIYFYKLETESFTETKKMILIK